MRIWHQSLIDLETAPAYAQSLETRARVLARPGTEIAIHGMEPGTYGEWSTAVAVRHVYLYHQLKSRVLAKMRTAAAEGFDAFAMVTLQDPAVREGRSVVPIPLVGYGEAAMHLACLLGDRFGIVAFNPPLFPLWQSQVEAHGLASRSVPIVDSGLTYEAVLRGFTDPGEVVEKFTVAARQSLDSGADVIIPGQSLLGEVLAASGVSRLDEAPVIDPLATTIKFAEALHDLRILAGIDITRRGFYFAAPPDDLLERLTNSSGSYGQ